MEKKKTPLLRAEHLKKQFPEMTQPLFQDLDFELFSGSSSSIQGRSGEGKSTLLHMLSGLEPISEGTLYFQETPFEKLNLDQVRNRSFGFLCQSFHLMEERDVLSNILFPVDIARWPKSLLKAEWKEKASSLLNRVGLKGREAQRVSTLSGGEKQRLTLARALILDPDILFLDEPTGNLDQTTSDQIVSLIFSLFHEGTISTLLMVTHDPLLAQRADHQYVLSLGKLHRK